MLGNSHSYNSIMQAAEFQFHSGLEKSTPFFQKQHRRQEDYRLFKYQKGLSQAAMAVPNEYEENGQ